MVIDPYGRITAEGEINERSIILGNTFTVPSTPASVTGSVG